MSAAKSAGVVGKWGSASFTSMRGANGADAGNSPAVARPKKFFKSRAAKLEEDVAVDDDEGRR